LLWKNRTLAYSAVGTACIPAGNNAIYSLYGNFTETPGDDSYCHPTLYWYAFWITTSGYILFGVFMFVCIVVIVVGICCIAVLEKKN